MLFPRPEAAESEQGCETAPDRTFASAMDYRPFATHAAIFIAHADVDADEFEGASGAVRAFLIQIHGVQFHSSHLNGRIVFAQRLRIMTMSYPLTYFQTL